MFLPSPLKLEGYGIEAFSFSTSKGYNPDQPIDCDGLKLTVEREYRTHKDNQSIHFIKLHIVAKPKKKGSFPYSLALSIGGVFEAKATERCPDEKLKGVVYANAPSILYGVAREYIYMATCHNICGPFMLPSISFVTKPTAQIESKE